jgi:hypothetical protein
MALTLDIDLNYARDDEHPGFIYFALLEPTWIRRQPIRKAYQGIDTKKTNWHILDSQDYQALKSTMEDIWPTIDLGGLQVDDENQPYFLISQNSHTKSHKGKLVAVKPRPKNGSGCGRNIWRCTTLEGKQLFSQYVSGLRIYYRVQGPEAEEVETEPPQQAELQNVINTLQDLMRRRS